MTKTLPADDLAPNLWITLRERLNPEGCPIDPERFERIERFEGGDGSPDAEGESESDPIDENPRLVRRRRRFPVAPGTPLKILASSVPYIYVSVLAPNGDEAGPVILDVRKHPVVRLDDSVPEAIQRFARAQSRKARRQAAREVEEKAMQRAYLSQAFKDVGHSGSAAEHDGHESSGDDQSRVTDRRRGPRGTDQPEQNDEPDLY